MTRRLKFLVEAFEVKSPEGFPQADELVESFKHLLEKIDLKFGNAGIGVIRVTKIDEKMVV